MDLLKKAMSIAAQAHNGQVRKHSNNIAYIVHPANVALAAAQYGLPIEVQAAALLHDVLEDTSVTEERLRQIFPACVIDLVVELTNPSHLPENKPKPREERKRIDREHLSKASVYAKILKMLDRIDNLRDMQGEGHSKKFKRIYIQESVELYKVICTAHMYVSVELMAEILALESSLPRTQVDSVTPR
jgi:guanosine-3',5'-bis(diphosphate) 3'-pyrophosphohydrolase